MQIIKQDLNIDFLGRRRISVTVSGVLIVAGLIAYFLMGGLNYGIDFRGGTLVQVRLPGVESLSAIRDTLGQADIGSFALQSFGEEDSHEYLVTLAQAAESAEAAGESEAGKVETALQKRFDEVDIRRIESVGPKVGAELKLAAAEAIVLSLALILVYVWVRFQWRYSIGAIVALFHDVLIVLAAFVVTQKEISLPVVAGILTVAGYSINDTIVIFDRIRENLRRFQRRERLALFNESVNQTLSRTLLTSGTTLFVVLAMYLFGGEIINDFAFALVIGVLVGTYSSVFIAAPFVYELLTRYPPKLR